jgi:hypothetical protein
MFERSERSEHSELSVRLKKACASGSQPCGLAAASAHPQATRRRLRRSKANTANTKPTPRLSKDQTAYDRSCSTSSPIAPATFSCVALRGRLARSICAQAAYVTPMREAISA